MKRLAAMLLAGLWLTAAGCVQALDLGDIEVGSLRGEPLMARIALVDVPEGEPWGLRVGLGGPEEFVRAGIERHDHLLSLEFEVVAEGPEPAHIMIRGRDPVDSSFTTFLVEAVWPEGRALREYTVLLDAAPPEPVASYGPVRRTDTLWSLAGRYRPEGVSVQRMMLAILALNPQAFSIANVNALREGAVLEIPAFDRIGPDEKDSAMQEVRRQNEAWRAYPGSTAAQTAASDVEAPESADSETVTPSREPAPEVVVGSRETIGQAQDGELRVVVPGTGEAADTDPQQKLRAELDLALEEADSRRQEIFELGARLDEAERLIVDLQRLVELKDDDIAGLQRRLAEEAEAAEQARSEATAQARAAVQAQAEAEAQGEAAARAREEARIQAEAAEVARAEALARVEAAAAAQAENVDSAVAAAALELLPEQEQEEGADSLADADAVVESTPAAQEEGEGAAPDESTAPPALLRTLEDTLGFSPVVGGVGLVGVILILGGLIALMRRRGSTREDSDEEDIPAEDDAASEFWGDETDFEEEGLESEDDDGPAPPATQASEDARQPTGDVPDIDDFDIGIDLDEELTRALEEQLEPDSDIDRGAAALERTLASAGESDVGPARSNLGPVPGARSELASGAGDEDLAVDVGGRRIRESDEAGPVLEGDRQRTSARRLGAVDPMEGIAAFAAGEGLSGDVDELQTKLDLAQTYIDMEDFENARTLLGEVQAEGGLEQRAIARYLSGKLP